MKNEFTLAFNEVLEDKQLPREVVLEAIQSAMVSAYRRAVNASNAQQIEAIVDPETGKVQIFAEKEVVEQVEDDRTEVSLEVAREVDPEAEIGSMVVVETTPANFGRVAAQTARQVIQQRIREAERDKQHKYFSSQIDEIVSGVIQAINPNQITLGLDLKAEGIIPRSQMIPGERFRVHERVRALLLDVKSTTRDPQIILSRSHKNFLRRLLENEVPEIYHGLVEIRSIAREPGHRSKVAVSALQPGIDPVGACVGIRGVRIQAIVRELNDEKIDVIEWNPDPSIYIAKALSPARVSGVYLNDFTGSTKTATVVVPEDQLSLAIGRVGQNARLAAKLTGWRIDIKSLPEAAADAIYKLQNEPDYAPLLEKEKEILPQIENILAKKAEGRPVTPEEYQVLGKFVDRIEHGYLRMLRDQRVAAEEAEQIARADIPAIAFQIPLSEFDISDRLFTVVSETGYETVGDLMLKLSIDPDSIYALNGMGPKAWAELQDAVEKLKQQAREQEQAEKEAEAIKAAEAEKEEISIEAVEAEGEAKLEEEAAAETELQISSEGEVEQLVEAPKTEGEEVSISGEAEGEGKEEKESELEEIFSVDLSEFEAKIQAEDEFDEEELDSKKKKKKKKKRKKYVELEYDPDEDVMLIKKKRKRADEEDWIEDW